MNFPNFLQTFFHLVAFSLFFTLYSTTSLTLFLQISCARQFTLYCIIRKNLAPTTPTAPRLGVTGVVGVGRFAFSAVCVCVACRPPCPPRWRVQKQEKGVVGALAVS